MSIGLNLGYEEPLALKISEEISELMIISFTKTTEKTSWLKTEVMINGNIHTTSSRKMSSLYW